MNDRTLDEQQLEALRPLAAVIESAIKDTPIRLGTDDWGTMLAAGILVRVAAYMGGVLPPPAARATVLLEAAEALGRMDYDTDSNDYGYDTYRDAWNGGVMDAAEELRRLAAGPGADLIEDYLRFLRGQGPEPDLSGLAPVQREAVAGQFKIVRALADRDAELPPLDRDPVARRLGLAAVAQPELEAGAAATLARECTDHAAVILWCAERVRSVDDDPALQDAADHLHGLSTRAQVDATPVTERAAIIRWCAQEIHSMGGNSAVERAAEYLDDLATEAEEEPAAECSAQHRSLDDGRLCIRAAQHRGDHIDERGFHWSDSVAVYPVADGTFRTGVRLPAVGARQPDTETRAEPPIVRWRLQIFDGIWASYGPIYSDRAEAVARYRSDSEQRPTWNDPARTPVQRRIVRETTSYTVERSSAGGSGAADETRGATRSPIPTIEPCPPGCIACATDESHDPAPATEARQDGAPRPTLRERHRAEWNALTPDEQTARIAALDTGAQQDGEQTQ